MPKLFALVLAAGHGTRIGDSVPKQYIPIAGKPMMFHSIEALAAVSRIERLFVVLAPLDRHWGEHDWSALPEKIEAALCGGVAPRRERPPPPHLPRTAPPRGRLGPAPRA